MSTTNGQWGSSLSFAETSYKVKIIVCRRLNFVIKYITCIETKNFFHYHQPLPPSTNNPGLFSVNYCWDLLSWIILTCFQLTNFQYTQNLKTVSLICYVYVKCGGRITTLSIFLHFSTLLNSCEYEYEGHTFYIAGTLICFLEIWGFD